MSKWRVSWKFAASVMQQKRGFSLTNMAAALTSIRKQSRRDSVVCTMNCGHVVTRRTNHKNQEAWCWFHSRTEAKNYKQVSKIKTTRCEYICICILHLFELSGVSIVSVFVFKARTPTECQKAWSTYCNSELQTTFVLTSQLRLSKKAARTLLFNTI